jgi:hypothetical protein
VRKKPVKTFNDGYLYHPEKFGIVTPRVIRNTPVNSIDFNYQYSNRSEANKWLNNSQKLEFEKIGEFAGRLKKLFLFVHPEKTPENVSLLRDTFLSKLSDSERREVEYLRNGS